MYLNLKQKNKGFLMVSAALTAIVFILLASSVAGVYSGMFSMLGSSRTASAAQQYAEIDANSLMLLPYDELSAAAHGRTDIAETDGWQSEVIIGSEKIVGDNRQRIGTVKVYKDGEGIARASLQVPLSSLGSRQDVPVGSIIIWSTWATPEKGAWLECNGQAVNPVLYPKLAMLMNYTPDFRGVFLRGVGSVTSTHYNTVLHQSGALNQLQGDSIRNIQGYVNAQNNSGYDGGDNGLSDSSMADESGALYAIYGWHKNSDDGDYASSHWLQGIGIDSSRAVPVSNENRPINIAVRYLIKAK